MKELFWIFYWTYWVIFAKCIHGYKVDPEIITLMDTDESKWRGWTKNTGKYEGWRTQNIPPSAQLVYGLCGPHKYPNKEYWLRSPYLERGEAGTIHIELQFSMRACGEVVDSSNSNNNNRGTVEESRHCEDTIQLLVREHGPDPGSWDESEYKAVAVVTPDTRWGARDSSSRLTKRDYSVSRSRGSSGGLHVAIRDRGACVMLRRVRVYYFACAPLVSGLAEYPRVVAGGQHEDVRAVGGRCMHGASLKDSSRPPRVLCRPDGHWHINSLPNAVDTFCHCNPGRTPSTRNDRCLECQVNTYKSIYGSSKCNYCPSHSHSPIGSTYCTCDPDFYPFYHKASLYCAQQPSGPQHLTGNFSKYGALHLNWQLPLITGHTSDLKGPMMLKYRVLCLTCPTNRLPLIYPSYVVNTTKVVIDGLEPQRKYEFSVVSENIVSNFTVHKESSSTRIIVTTPKPIPNYVIRQLKVLQPNSQKIRLLWSPPKNKPRPIKYQIISRKTAKQTPNVLYSLNTNCDIVLPLATFSSLRIKVRAIQVEGYGKYSEDVIVNVTEYGSVSVLHIPSSISNDIDGRMNSNNNNSNNTFITTWSPSRILLMMLFGLSLLLVIIGVPICLYCRFMRLKKRVIKKKAGQTISKETIGLTEYSQINSASTIKVYIDPSTHEDPSMLIQEFTKEIDPTQISIESVIGEGEFGEVCKGRLKLDRSATIKVAVKTLKTSCSEKQRRDFLVEAGIMGQFVHENVIRLEGVVTKTTPVMIITRFMENGALDSFLRKHRGQFNILQLLRILRGIAAGMKYLAEMKYVHRDLAARNVLVSSDLTCKVSDFGLSREILADNTEGAYTTKGGLIPIRWTAPEAINYRRFTSSSDVWSYGVVMWEVLSYGQRPYWHWNNRDVLQAIETGYRLPAPHGSPHALHQLMLACWQSERAQRPKFNQILRTIEIMSQTPEMLSAAPFVMTTSNIANTSLGRNFNFENNVRCHSNSLNNLINGIAPLSRIPYNEESPGLLIDPIQLPEFTSHPSLQSQNYYQKHELNSSPERSLPTPPPPPPLPLFQTTSDPIFGPESSVSQWLACLALSRHESLFTTNRITTLNLVALMTRDSLANLGITDVDDLNKLLSNIEAMRNYFALPPSLSNDSN